MIKMLLLVDMFLLMISTVNGADSGILLSNLTGYILKDRGESLTVFCSNDDNDQCYYKWYKNGKYFQNSSKLTLVSIQSSDEGLYECTDCNSSNESFYLDTKVFAPREANNDSQISVCSPVENITLSRIIYAKPRPTIVNGSYLLPENVNEADVLFSLETNGGYEYLLQWNLSLSSSKFYGQFCVNTSNAKGTLKTCFILKPEDSCTTISLGLPTINNSTEVVELDDPFSFINPLNLAIGLGVPVAFSFILIVVALKVCVKKGKRGGYKVEQEESIESHPLKQAQTSVNKAFNRNSGQQKVNQEFRL